MNTIKAANNLACPIDGRRLVLHDKQMICEDGHVFDIARQGYVNLLTVQHKRSKHPGDNKAMVSARTHFLNSGCYEPIANTLADITLAQLAAQKAACILDAGCGEGYYVDYVFNYLEGKGVGCDLSFIGLDISKAAIAASAKRNKQITWVVGTNRQPPVKEGSVDCILCVFGFQHFDGFKKILKPGGRIILVEPGPDHLRQLREIIYSDVKKATAPGFSCVEDSDFLLVDRQSLQFSTEVMGKQQVNHLLMMTPHFHRATASARATLSEREQLKLSIDVVFRILEKK